MVALVGVWGVEVGGPYRLVRLKVVLVSLFYCCVCVSVGHDKCPVVFDVIVGYLWQVMVMIEVAVVVAI